MFGWVVDGISWVMAAIMLLAIGGTGLVLIAALVVGYFPLLRWTSYAAPARFAAFLSFGVLAALVTLQLAGDRCDALRADDRAAAASAAEERDRGIARDLDRKYRPEIVRLNKLTADMRKAMDNAKRTPIAAGACRLGVAAGRLPAQ